MFDFEWFIKGGPIMFPLLACSVISLTITFERLIFWIRQRAADNPQLLAKVIAAVESGDHDTARKLAAQSDDYLLVIINNALAQHPANAEATLKQAADKQVVRMGRYLRILDTIVTIAPLLGILGTVIGIISSFDVLGTTGVDDPMAATSGIAQALVTTAVGLVIAMVTLIPYNYFLAKVDTAVTSMETQLTHFQTVYQKGTQPG